MPTAKRQSPKKKLKPADRRLAVYWFPIGDVLVVADDPVQLGPKPILFLIEVAGEVWVNPGMMEVCEGDLERLTAASRAFDEDRLIAAMIIAEKAYKPVLNSGREAAARLHYVARGGVKAFQPKEFDKDDWLILKRWPFWRSSRITRWKDRLTDFEEQSGKNMESARSLEKRCERLDLLPHR